VEPIVVGSPQTAKHKSPPITADYTRDRTPPPSVRFDENGELTWGGNDQEIFSQLRAHSHKEMSLHRLSQFLEPVVVRFTCHKKPTSNHPNMHNAGDVTAEPHNQVQFPTLRDAPCLSCSPATAKRDRQPACRPSVAARFHCDQFNATATPAIYTQQQTISGDGMSASRSVTNVPHSRPRGAGWKKRIQPRAAAGVYETKSLRPTVTLSSRRQDNKPSLSAASHAGTGYTNFIGKLLLRRRREQAAFRSRRGDREHRTSSRLRQLFTTSCLPGELRAFTSKHDRKLEQMPTSIPAVTSSIRFAKPIPQNPKFWNLQQPRASTWYAACGNRPVSVLACSTSRSLTHRVQRAITTAPVSPLGQPAYSEQNFRYRCGVARNNRSGSDPQTEPEK